MRLRDLGERALLKRLAPLGYPEGAPLPPGDDAGGVWVGEAAWLLKTDGFLYREVALLGMGPFEVGFRGVAATASDLLSKMGRPLGFTLGLFLPWDLEEAFALELVRGAVEAARRLGAPLLGGDTNAGEEVALTVSGFALSEAPLPRKALPGDLLYLAGDRWGRTGAGIRAHYQGIPLESFAEIREAVFYPLPRLELLALAGLPRGSLDSSDGLAETLWQVSELGVRVDLEALPLYPDVLAFAGGEDEALELVLYGGEEFEAVLVVPPEAEGAVLARAEAVGLPLFRAGRVGEGEGVYLRGDLVLRKGYDHFRP
jgi:thiamine-monophosphate kinase